MTDEFTIYISNQIESLYFSLTERLFNKKQNPFIKRLVVVPGPAMKSWLMLQLANDPRYEIAMGVDIVYLDQAMSMIQSRYEKGTREKIPSHTELALAIETEIKSVTTSSVRSEQWDSLFSYLFQGQERENGITTRINRRIINLSHELATLFEKYGLFAGKLLEKTSDHWQWILWNNIWKKRSHWTYPYRKYSKKFETLQKEAAGITVSIFGLSFFSHLQNEFFKNISKDISVAYYLISPSQMFWSDIVSDRERRYLGDYWKKKGASEGERIQLDEYLRDRNPLLANFGKSGRETATLIEESNAHIEESYILPESALNHPFYRERISEENQFYSSSDTMTALQAIQSDMLLLRTPSTSDELFISPDDTSISVHCAPTKLREVRIIYDLILSIIESHHEEITPSDFIVMSPNIMDYVPYIRAVFHDKESVLDAQIMDVNLPAKNPLVQGYLKLLKLADSRWDVLTLLELLDFEPFQRKHKLLPEDVLTIRKWMKASGVRWGINGAHRNLLLKKSHCSHGMIENSEIGTIEYGIDRLLAGMVYSTDKETPQSTEFDILPLEGIEGSQADLCGKWIALIDRLKVDLLPLENGQLLSLEEWISRLQILYESYFSAISEDNEEQLTSLFSNLRNAAKDLQDATFPFETIKYHMESLLNKETTSYRETHLHAVRFFSMLPMRAIPVKAIILMGMEENSFPKQEKTLSLNLMIGQKDADYYPSQIDFDRYLFLEILLSARNYFIMTYLNQQSGDGEECSPSLLVTELIDYIQKYYRIPEEHLIIRHPFYSFDKRYFEPTGKLKSYSSSTYRMALAYYKEDKDTPHRFVPEFHPHDSTILKFDETELVLDIKKLKNLAKEPLKHYLTQRFGIYLDREEDREIKNEEEFSLTHLNKVMLSREGLIRPLAEVKKIAAIEGKIPSGLFKGVSTHEIMEEHRKLHDKILHAGANPEALFTIDCHVTCTSPHTDESGNLNLPPLEIPVNDRLTVKLVGTLPLVATQGLIAHVSDNTLEEAIKVWPEYLFFISLVQYYRLPIEMKLLCTKTGKVKNPYVGDSIELLKIWIQYYLESLETPSPLLPGWSQELIKEDNRELKEKIHKDFHGSFSPFYDEYAKWALSPDALPESDKLIDQWKGKGKSIFGEMPSQWFQKKFSCNEVD